MLSTTEQYLVESIRNGDRKAFEFLYRNYYQDLCRYARNLVLIETVAEDLVMDVFTKVWEAGEKLVITTSLSGYLFTSVHNHCLNYLTRKHKRFTELDNATIEKLNKVIPADSVASPFDTLSTLELAGIIDRSIGSLPEECRKVFVMSRTNGMSNREIATALGISENTVKVQIYRALKKLRIILRDFLPSTILL
jgi:RNA polymerase sigma-70 factor (ECF subfamily)